MRIGDRGVLGRTIQEMMERKNRYYQNSSEIGPEYLLSGAGELWTNCEKLELK